MKMLLQSLTIFLDLWIAVKGVVMDVTNWLDEHPGGPQAVSFTNIVVIILILIYLHSYSHTWAATPVRSSKCYTMTKLFQNTLPTSLLAK